MVCTGIELWLWFSSSSFISGSISGLLFPKAILKQQSSLFHCKAEGRGEDNHSAEVYWGKLHAKLEARCGTMCFCSADSGLHRLWCQALLKLVAFSDAVASAFPLPSWVLHRQQWSQTNRKLGGTDSSGAEIQIFKELFGTCSPFRVKWPSVSNIWWSVMSNAAQRSHKTRKATSPLSNSNKRSYVILTKAVSVLWCALKPDWNFSNKPLLWRKSHNWLFSWKLDDKSIVGLDPGILLLSLLLQLFYYYYYYYYF